MAEGKSKHSVQINYKSGRSVKVTVDNFTVKRTGGSRSFEWENMQPRPLLLGADDIESVYEL